MENIYEVKQIIDSVTTTSSRNEKESIIHNNRDNQLLRDILYFVYSPYILTGLSKKKISKKMNLSQEQSTLSIIEIMDHLKTHNSGRDTDIQFVQHFIKSQPEDLQEFYTKIVTKDFTIGITADTINKVFGDFIPTFDVMLAKKFEDHKHKIKDSFVVTKKLDGNRLVVIKENGIVKSFTRQGKQYDGLEEIESDIYNLKLDNVVFDGELIADIEGDTIEIYAETTSKARKKGKNKTGLIFHIFDMMPLDNFKKGKSIQNCIDRKNILSKLFEDYSLPHCKEVTPLYIGNDLPQIEVLKEYAKEQGWEGLMVNLDTPYVCKRTDTILKVKVFNDADLKVVDVIEGTGKNEGKLGSIVVQFEHEGKLYECNCGSGFSDNERDLYWKQPELLKSKIVTIGFFEISKNADGGYGLRFPTWKGIIRHDKTEISMN